MGILHFYLSRQCKLSVGFYMHRYDVVLVVTMRSWLQGWIMTYWPGSVFTKNFILPLGVLLNHTEIF